jgi:hypothetical protein
MAIRTTTTDRNSRNSSDTVRQEHNKLLTAFYYFMLNGLMSTTIATLPAVATGTTTSKIKTTNASVAKNNGVANAVAATDDAWTLTGGVLAVSSFRRYLLLVSATDVFTVQASTDAATAAACVFNNLPATGLAILGIVTIATNGSTTFTPGTTLLGAAGITTTYIDGIDDSIILPALVNL